MPTVDCIISTYNRASHFLPRAVLSVQNQTHTDWLLTIADDCSTDRTRLIAEAFRQEDPRVQYVCTPKNSGFQSVPKNLAIRATSAPMIAYLDDDNEWTPDHLAELVATLQKHHADLVYGAREFVNDPVHPHPKPMLLGDKMYWNLPQIMTWVPQLLGAMNWVDTSDMLHTRALLKRIGGWNESARQGADWDLIRRVASAGATVVNVPKVLTKYYWHSAGHKGVGG